MLITSHRFSYSIDEWHAIFKLRGINALSIEILPQLKDAKTRKEEILHWLNNTVQVPDFILIDDDKSLNGLPENQKARLLLTSGSLGLTADLAEQFLAKQ
ncbi:hypothetical protein AM493_14610 [Flavobacterium akiainvivens]|uniref:Uncharacterized protein n=2 Tax=Flavobacterium akiainvivens TaxID=1202724 RepID=A0A0M8ME58_9FLAO|nr:hypothetical protein AM493_14610 [Flavobacterium akiainvivens]